MQNINQNIIRERRLMKKLYICAFSLMAVSWITAIAFPFVLPEQTDVPKSVCRRRNRAVREQIRVPNISCCRDDRRGAVFACGAKSRQKRRYCRGKGICFVIAPRYGNFLFYGTFLHARRLGAINNIVSNLYFSVDSTTRKFNPNDFPPAP